MNLRVGIITSFDRGVAAHHLQFLKQNHLVNCELIGVIHVLNPPLRKKNFWARKIRKILKIGPLGTLNGIRMRPWFTNDVDERLGIPRIQDVCNSHNVSLQTVQQLNSNSTRSILREWNLDLAISLGNGFIGASVFSIPQYGMINIHHEILPEFRNAQSVIWQLYHKSSFTGYSIHKIDRGIDAGEILHQEQVPIAFNPTLRDTVAATIANCWDRSAAGLHNMLLRWDEIIPLESNQNRKIGHYTTPSFFQYLRIWWNWRQLHRAQN